MIPFIVWGALLALVFVGPPIKRGGLYARNHGFGVTLPDDDTTIMQGQDPEGRKAHEVAEFRLAWLFGLIAAFPVCFFVDGLFSVLVPVVAAVGQSLTRAVTGQLDYVGHGVEIITVGKPIYRIDEIERMMADRPGMTFEQVERKLDAWHWLAVIGSKIV